MNCEVCNKEYSPDCNYRQGRCPHHPPLITMDEHTPNPKLHKQISLVKSGLRIIAGIELMVGNYFMCGVLLIVAELLGIAEELV